MAEADRPPPQKRATTKKTQERPGGVALDSGMSGKGFAVGPDTATGATASPWSMTALLEMESIQRQTDFIREWSQEVKTRVDDALLKFLKLHEDSVPFDPPADVMSISSAGYIGCSRWRELNCIS